PYEILLQHVSIVPCLCVFGISHFGLYYLYSSTNAFLAECAVKDKVWGIGLSMTDPKRLEPSLWRGQNLLGFALMMVRKKLK
ncbi:MAG: DUF1768 domain-containing protein, partial [Roseburia sp.]|nr:DUF1768 domain-containing protein [Roseburia sp.]